MSNSLEPLTVDVFQPRVGETFRIRVRPDNELEAELIEARALNAIGPDLVPLDAADGAHQVDLHRRHAHLHHPTTIRYRFGTQLRHGTAERLERLENPHRVFQLRPNEDVDIDR